MFNLYSDMKFNPYNYNLYRGSIFDIVKFFNSEDSKNMLEIYRKTLSLFEYVRRIKPNELKINILKKGKFGSRLGSNGVNPEIDLVSDSSEISERLIDRCFLRCGLDRTKYTKKEIIGILMCYAIAHELGHLIQGSENDTTFANMFGIDIDRDAFLFVENKAYEDSKVYNKYLSDDLEVNADFISLYILGSWKPEIYTSPVIEGYFFRDWRKWGKKHTLEFIDEKIIELDTSGISY